MHSSLGTILNGPRPTIVWHFALSMRVANPLILAAAYALDFHK
jgi:hypothetical protein